MPALSTAHFRPPVLFLALLLLTACGHATVPTPVVVVEPPAPPRVAPECTSADPAWTDLPARDVTQGELARLWRRNRAAFRTVVAARAVCREGLLAVARSDSPAARRSF